MHERPTDADAGDDGRDDTYKWAIIIIAVAVVAAVAIVIVVALVVYVVRKKMAANGMR